MIRNYFNAAIRNMKRNLLFSILNVIGLSIGIATCFVVVNFLVSEYSFDNFHEKGDNIYNVYFNVSYPNEDVKVGRTTSGIGPAMVRDLSEVEDYARLYRTDITVVKDESGFKEEEVFWADGAILNIFSFPLIEGDKNSVLKDPYTVIISESTARKYFGEEKAYGKFIKVFDPGTGLEQEDFKVVGVFRDVPYNSHIQFNVLLSYATLVSIDRDFFSENHISTFLYTFVELNSDANLASFDKKMQDLTYKYQPRSEEDEIGYSYNILPYKQLHRTSLEYPLNHIFNKDQAFLMLLLAIIVLIVGWFNYINIANVKSMERAKEVGVRKLLGSNKIQLIRQFIAESLVINVVATFLAIFLVSILKDVIVEIIEVEEVLFVLKFPWFWGYLFLFVIFSALLSGLYPAFVLSSFKPATVLKGDFRGSKRGILVRKILMISQFVVAITLGIGTIVIHMQVKLAKSNEKKINIDNVLIINSPQIEYQNGSQNFINFKEELKQFPFIESVSTSNFIPGQLINDRARMYRVSGEGQRAGAGNMLIGSDYFDTYKVEILEGNDFSYYNENQYNEKAMITWVLARVLGYKTPEDAIGELVTFRRETFEIIGIVDDYKHMNNMRTRVVGFPLIFRSEQELYRYISIRHIGNNYAEINKAIQNVYNKYFPGAPYNYQILTDYYDLQYRKETRFLSIFNVFAILSIVLGLIGLIGLVSYMLIQKTKQIGIRKVLGANVINVLQVLYKELGYLMLIANIVAWPIIYYIMKSWLQNFPLRVEQNILWYFVIGLCVLLIAILSVFYQVLRVSRLNPVEVLREE